MLHSYLISSTSEVTDTQPSRHCNPTLHPLDLEQQQKYTLLKGNTLKQFKFVLVSLLQIAAFAVATGALVYLADSPAPGFSRMGTSLLVAGCTFVALPVNLMGIALLDEYLDRRSNRSF